MRRQTAIIPSILTLFACSIPTGDVCGCPPAVSTIRVTGRVGDGRAAPLPRARVEFSAIPSTRPDTAWARSDLVSGTPLQTDSLGAFRTRLLSASMPGTYTHRMRVITAGGRDTTQGFAGAVRFAQQGTKEDSLFVAVTVP